MTHRTKLVVILGAMALSALAAPGCGGGDTSGSSATGGSSGGTGGTGGATGGTGGTTGGTGGTTGGTGGTTGGTGGGGGMPSSDLGAPGSAFVNAGGQAKSANYRMVFTLGQSTQNQGTTTSASYSLHGGIIGATGSFK